MSQGLIGTYFLKLLNAQDFTDLIHTLNSGSEMVVAKHVSGKNNFGLLCPLEPPTKWQQPTGHLGWI